MQGRLSLSIRGKICDFGYIFEPILPAFDYNTLLLWTNSGKTLGEKSRRHYTRSSASSGMFAWVIHQPKKRWSDSKKEKNGGVIAYFHWLSDLDFHLFFLLSMSCFFSLHNLLECSQKYTCWGSFAHNQIFKEKNPRFCVCYGDQETVSDTSFTI